MTNIKENERFIPVKNYLIAAGIVVVIIALAWYAFAWYRVVKESKVSTSYLVKEKIISKEITDLNEVTDVFSEVPTSYFIYISYTGDEDIYNMEKDLQSVINEYNLNDSIYYINVTSIKDDKDCIDKINEALSLNDTKITSIPTIIYYSNGKPVDIITRNDDNIINTGDFQKMLDVNHIEK